MPPPSGQPYLGAYLQDRLSAQYGPATKAALEANLDRIYTLLRTVNRNGELPAGTENDLLYFSDGGLWTALAFVSTNQRVIGNSTGAPAWEQVDLTAGVSGDLPLSNLAGASAASRLLGRGSASGAGDWQEITLSTGLSMSGTALSATGTGQHYEPVVGGTPTDPELLFNVDGDLIMALVDD